MRPQVKLKFQNMGLQAFHRREMIHQDIKPKNVLIDARGTVKIIDSTSTGVAGLATHRDPARRYDALTAFATDLSRPNPAFKPPKARPLLERNPAAFWRGLALLSVLLNLVLLVLFAE